MEGVDSSKPLSEGADGGVVMRSCLFARDDLKDDERCYTPEEQEEIDKFLKDLNGGFASIRATPYVRPLPLPDYKALKEKNEAIRKEEAALLRKDKAAFKAKKREDRKKREHLKKWRNLHKLFDRSIYEESYQITHWRCRTAGAEVPSTHEELHEMLQSVWDHYAKFALEYYNEKNMGTKFELVKGLKLFPFPGPRIERIKYPHLRNLSLSTGWCHINFTAKPINADSSVPSEAKLFFAEMHGIFRKDSEFIPGVTRCCIVEPNNSDEASCAYCKGILHPAGIDFIASPLVRGFTRGGKSLRREHVKPEELGGDRTKSV